MKKSLLASLLLIATMSFLSCEKENGKNAHQGVQLWENGPEWATTNIGANKPEEAGLYFQWGNVTGYKPNNGSFDYAFSPETYLGTEGSLLVGDIPADSKYDAAVALWGNGWRMPTANEFHILMNLASEWTENYNGSGVAGWIFRGEGEYSKNSIFMPAASYGRESSVDVSSGGLYWSSTFCSKALYGGSCSYIFTFNEGTLGVYNFSDKRMLGFTIRPVLDR